jgi:glycosyl transferase family 25
MIKDLTIYAICLEREVERRQRLNVNLSFLDVDPVFVGIDGNNLPKSMSERNSEREAFKQWGRALTQGEVGCYASHLLVWEQVANGDNEFALVLESDAVLTKEALNMIELILREHRDVDLVMLSWADCIPSVWGRRRLSESYKLVQFARKTHVIAAYLLSRTGARELLDKSHTIAMPVDEFMCGGMVVKNMVIRGVYPKVVQLMEHAQQTSTLAVERGLGNAKASGCSVNRSLLKRFERFIRHVSIMLRRPPKI